MITKTLPAGPVVLLTLSVYFGDKATTAKDGYDYLLRPFLKWLRSKGAEPLQWKGFYNIHAHLSFHVLFRFTERIDHKELREAWNEQQRKTGILDEYKKMSGHYDPASIDVKVFKEPAADDLKNYFPDLEDNNLK